MVSEMLGLDLSQEASVRQMRTSQALLQTVSSAVASLRTTGSGSSSAANKHLVVDVATAMRVSAAMSAAGREEEGCSLELLALRQATSNTTRIETSLLQSLITSCIERSRALDHKAAASAASISTSSSYPARLGDVCATVSVLMESADANFRHAVALQCIGVAASLVISCEASYETASADGRASVSAGAGAGAALPPQGWTAEEWAEAQLPEATAGVAATAAAAAAAGAFDREPIAWLSRAALLSVAAEIGASFYTSAMQKGLEIADALRSSGFDKECAALTMRMLLRMLRTIRLHATAHAPHYCHASWRASVHRTVAIDKKFGWKEDPSAKGLILYWEWLNCSKGYFSRDCTL